MAAHRKRADYSVCALKNDGTAWCSDENLFGYDRRELVRVGSDTTFGTGQVD